MHYKPTDFHNYLLYSSSHPSHAKNAIPYSQFLSLRRLCGEDSEFSLKSESNFFDERGYPVSLVQESHHRTQQIDWHPALQTSQKKNNYGIPFTLTATQWEEQGWCSGESARLPPMCPGFDSRTRHHMWAEFVGSLLCSERFFSGNSGFPLSSKTNI